MNMKKTLLEYDEYALTGTRDEMNSRLSASVSRLSAHQKRAAHDAHEKCNQSIEIIGKAPKIRVYDETERVFYDNYKSFVPGKKNLMNPDGYQSDSNQDSEESDTKHELTYLLDKADYHNIPPIIRELFQGFADFIIG